MKNTANIVYSAQSFKKACNAGVKPPVDFEDVLRRLGGVNIGLPRIYLSSVKVAYHWSRLSAQAASFRIPLNGLLFLQYPGQNYGTGLLRVHHQARARRARIAYLIHDINSLRGGNDNDTYLNEADVLIVHTANMARWLDSKLSSPRFVILGIFDYLTDFRPSIKIAAGPVWRIAFAGNLAKAAFISKISGLPETISYMLYGNGLPSGVSLDPNITYCGTFTPEKLLPEIENNHFGLVWDGDSADTCSGHYGEYLRYNAPYKASSYLAAGLPLIVWDQMGIAEFVIARGIGITVSSLGEIPARLAALAPEEYERIRTNALLMQELIATGHFYESAIKEVSKIADND